MQESSPSLTRHSHTPVVICRGITKSYGSGETRTQALRGIDLTVEPGELLMALCSSLPLGLP